MALETSLKSILTRIAGKANKIGQATTEVFHDTLGRNDVGWPDLAIATQSKRVAQGYSIDEPLLRSGVTRDSFTHEVKVSDDGLYAEIIVGIKTGTIRTFPYDFRPHDIGLLMVWHELGTVTEPPRPLLPLVANYLRTTVLLYALRKDSDIDVTFEQTKI